MIKKFIIVLLVLVSCRARVLKEFDLSSIKEITYDSPKKHLTITDSVKINEVIQILNKGKRHQYSIIVIKDTITLKKYDGSIIKIYKGTQYISINKRRYHLNKHLVNKLNKILGIRD